MCIFILRFPQGKIFYATITNYKTVLRLMPHKSLISFSLVGHTIVVFILPDVALDEVGIYVHWQ